MHVSSAELCSVSLPPYYDYDVCKMTFLGSICHIIVVINLHKLWDPNVFEGSYLSSTLEHVG